MGLPSVSSIDTRLIMLASHTNIICVAIKNDINLLSYLTVRKQISIFPHQKIKSESIPWITAVFPLQLH